MKPYSTRIAPKVQDAWPYAHTRQTNLIEKQKIWLEQRRELGAHLVPWHRKSNRDDLKHGMATENILNRKVNDKCQDENLCKIENFGTKDQQGAWLSMYRRPRKAKRTSQFKLWRTTAGTSNGTKGSTGTERPFYQIPQNRWRIGVGFLKHTSDSGATPQYW